MSIDLSDEGLGPLTLQAANGVGGLQLRLTAGDRAVGDALAASAHELRRDLEASGTLLGSLDVGHRDTPGNPGNQGRDGRGLPDRPSGNGGNGGNGGNSGNGRNGRIDAPAARAVANNRPSSTASGLDLLI
jgi:hypothetical protein